MAHESASFFMEEPTIKPTVYTEDPFSYNYISLKKSEVNELPVPTARQLIATPVYNIVGKLFGIDTIHDWNNNYDKVFKIVEWAKERSGLKDPLELEHYIDKISRETPNIGAKNIDSLYAKIKLIGDKHE